MADYIPTNRERSKDAERTKMSKSGKNTGYLYQNALRKRAAKAKILAIRKAQRDLTSDSEG